MARQTVIVSDLSGEPIQDGQATKVAVTTADARYELDANRSEVENLIQAGRRVGRRGRRPKQKS